jgi:hypothetical protein
MSMLSCVNATFPWRSDQRRMLALLTAEQQ